MSIGYRILKPLTIIRPRLRIPRSAIGVALLGCAAVLLPMVIPYGPTELSAGPALDAPSLSHPFGTDQFGRDVLARIVGGARLSLGISVAATGIALFSGALLGALAATSRGVVEEMIMRGTDTVMSLPGILLAIVLAAVLGSGWVTTTIVISVVYAPVFTRLVRANVLGELTQDYTAAARLLGSSRRRLLTYHVCRNIVAPISAYVSVVIAEVIVLEAALSFIGVGIPPPAPSWGNVVADGRDHVLSGVWWISLFGGVAIFTAVLLFYRLGETLRNGRGGSA